MKRVRTASLILLSLVALVVITFKFSEDYSSIKAYTFPSTEMKELKQIIQDLTLPSPTRKELNDSGYHTDYKGARHYQRNIRYCYEDQDTISFIKDSVEQTGWTLVTQTDFLAGETMYQYDHPKHKVRISITINPTSDGDIHTLGDDHCIDIMSRHDR